MDRPYRLRYMFALHSQIKMNAILGDSYLICFFLLTRHIAIKIVVFRNVEKY